MKNIKEIAERIRWFIMDVDGVLTDGGIIYDSGGNELKKFCVKDGMGITLLHNAGIKTAILTSRNSPMVQKRAEELRISEVIQGAKDKLNLYENLKAKHNLADDEILYIGDDFVDLPVLKRVGFPVCVKNSPDELKEVCVYITKNEGGKGAVRETAELLLKMKGLYSKAIEKYTGV
ncbi:3-deoxy-D-manno-octulosonate 8-phosphate phosphatase (KDO 8-P phosphatase) [Persephonella hydrogeniphila]|uniref:3-deoxy-D-manno-octulosonate 8-phosphate phosphatase (KDO 8-P phosphatase) n=1 Tax=Persephonella hydrogeniphila TaxID=198703 RepID=A0A285NF16_9AQUI|nr:HAD-IIIA family hydrolase [Persephonella hydrogeniphila]SNZ06496.1 3-deoxy-D-manno-octulosonate 8-phosphate phosphatase (KDO 8-P phosphatase) [Persephonella hydrogeniphila]